MCTGGLERPEFILNHASKLEYVLISIFILYCNNFWHLANPTYSNDPFLPNTTYTYFLLLKALKYLFLRMSNFVLWLVKKVEPQSIIECH